MNSNNIYVAKLGRTIGLQGHLKLFIDSDFPNQFKKGATFTTNKGLSLTIFDYNPNKELVRFDGYLDIDLAKKLTNSELFSSVEDTKANCKLKENEFFWFDLISCEVFEDGISLGVVKDIHRFPLNDYLEVLTSKKLLEEKLPKTFLIPHIFGNFIESVDIDNKKILVKNAFDILKNS